MAARCASCSYPLSVSHCVSCCECLSYFHIDCAQLVGFPYYELSSEPIRNTFHCQTCKILPLPRQSTSFSDSDSDDECAMPSRQLDYHLESQPDFVKDMNEIKGTVQDLSELCKDMFREINELKSINLTLRCCVENLRHDGEQRDGIIGELKRRLDALEGKEIVSTFKPINTTNDYVDRVNVDKDEAPERYLTPDPEYSRIKDMESLEEGNLQNDETLSPNEKQNSNRPNLESEVPEERDNSKIKKPQHWEKIDSEIDTAHTEDSLGVQTDLETGKVQPTNEEEVHFADEKIVSTATSEVNIQKEDIGSVKDWGWKGNKAISLDKEENESSEEENPENEASDIGEAEAQGWEILNEDVKSGFVTKHYKEEASENVADDKEVINEDKKVTWAEDVDDYDGENDTAESDEEAEESIPKSNTGYFTERLQARTESILIGEGEETEELEEDSAATDAEVAERTSLKDEEGDETPKLETDIEIVEGVEVEDYIKAIYTGRVESAERPVVEGEPRLEGDPAAEDGAVPAGEAGEGGQSPGTQGEVQPSEPSEDSEPPPPPQPQHTPDDLWEYLKDAVTGEHPATVEEFVQKLIGTLEHVPEEYLKPVIDYNIKRATSPSVTDGDHLDAREGDHHLEQTGSGEDLGQGNVDEERSHTTERETSAEGDTFSSNESAALHEDTTNILEEPSESPEGYSALEGALFGGFWVAWLLYSYWDS